MPSHRSPFRDLLVAEAIRAFEAQEQLPDAGAMRIAAHAASGREARILERARVLAKELELDADLRLAWRAIRWLGVLLLLAGTLLASSVVAGVLGDGRKINAAAALGLALLPNLIGLPIWIVAVLLARGGEGLFGHALRAAARRGTIGKRASTVLIAGMRVLDRHRLTPWVWGGANHLLWAIAYAFAIVAMTIVFGFRNYQLDWETTIFPPRFFDALFRTFAWGLAWLDFDSLQSNRRMAGSDASSAELAWWLIRATLVYGLGLRLLALAVCWLRWSHGERRLSIDFSDPYYRVLVNRFEALAPTRVVDEEGVGRSGVKLPARAHSGSGSGLAVVGFELPGEAEVPTKVLAAAAWIARIDGTQAERASVLQRLSEDDPRRVLLVCHAKSTPDRGTERFFADARAELTALLLVPTEQPAAYVSRWRAWLDQAGLSDVPVFVDQGEVLDWMAADA